MGLSSQPVAWIGVGGGRVADEVEMADLGCWVPDGCDGYAVVPPVELGVAWD